MSLLADLPRMVQTDAILSQWRALENWFVVQEHTFPRPVWARRGFEHDGPNAWEQVARRIGRKTMAAPLSLYLHIPFCERKCGFCDLFSHPLPRSQRHVERVFAEALYREMDVWASLPSLTDRPVTTVHLGGGTPNHLTPSVLNQIVAACRDHFNAGQQTEWALESTSRLLSPEQVRDLQTMGFSRLHVGVQCLDDGIRRRIGRKDTSVLVLAKLQEALAQGLIVSVDIIYGLPAQTGKDLLHTLELLADIGVHGVSLYQLQICDRNRAFLGRVGAGQPNPLFHYVLYQAAEQFLRSRGYRKNFFTHFALPPDRCLYYHHVRRGEDLLALGPTADGVFGDYLYRHLDYPAYAEAPTPALEGGIAETPLEQALRPAVAALMTGTLTGKALADLHATPLLDLWCACHLLAPAQGPGTFELTANGSWFMTQMIGQLHRRAHICAA